MGTLSDYGSVFERWSIWALMGQQDISLRYRRSFLGPFWLSISMATMVFAIGLLFSEVQGQPFKEFLSYFGVGMLAWTFLVFVTTESCTAVVDNESNLRNLPLPIPLLAARIVYRNLIIFAHNAVVIGAMLALFGQPISLSAWLAVAGLALYIPLGVFLGALLGPICARFRDGTQIVASIMQILFFLTPIFWVPHSAMSRPIVVEANPFYHLIEIVRRPLLGGTPTDLNWIVSLSVLGVVAVFAVITTAVSRKRIFLWL